MMTQTYWHAIRYATYWAVYPDGRRCSVTLEDAKAFGDVWEKEENVRVVTVMRDGSIEIIGQIESE